MKLSNLTENEAIELIWATFQTGREGAKQALRDDVLSNQYSTPVYKEMFRYMCDQEFLIPGEDFFI